MGGGRGRGDRRGGRELRRWEGGGVEETGEGRKRHFLAITMLSNSF